VIVMPISDRHIEAAKAVVDMLLKNDMRVHLDDRSETINYRIREAQVQQTPYMVVLGDKEVEEGLVAVRHRRGGSLGTMKAEELLTKLKAEIESKESI
jgi:threonyl-tRNA synthetase